jgi:hypothetical protein
VDVRGRLLSVACGVAVVAALAPGAAGATPATYTVSSLGDATVPSSCPGNVCPNLRSAIEAANANPGSTIQLGSGTYTLAYGSLDITANMTIVGLGAAQTTIQQTDPGYRVLDVTSAAVTLESLEITGGDAKAEPGDIWDGTGGGFSPRGEG